MKREVAAIVASSLAGKPANMFYSITAYQVDGSGWYQSLDDLIGLLDQERYVLYEVSFNGEGMTLDVWFTTVSIG